MSTVFTNQSYCVYIIDQIIIVRRLCDCNRSSEHDRNWWINRRALYKWKVLSLLKSLVYCITFVVCLFSCQSADDGEPVPSSWRRQPTGDVDPYDRSGSRGAWSSRHRTADGSRSWSNRHLEN